MAQTIPTLADLFKSGAHFGHRRNHTDARSHKFVHSYKNKVAVINLEKTVEQLSVALSEIRALAAKGATFIFVGTKLQAKDIVKKTAEELSSQYIIERWPGGLLTNFDVIIKGIKKMNKTEDDLANNKLSHLKKKEILKIQKDLAKQKNIFGGLKNLTGKPDMVIVVDAKQEDIAIKEATKESIPVTAICDTNSNPGIVSYPIVANDDSRKTIELILGLIRDEIKANLKSKVIDEEAAVEERVKKASEIGKAPVEIQDDLKPEEKKTIEKTTKKPKISIKSQKTAATAKKATKAKKS
jgi:small subunit ribosomal protein S2